MVVYTLSSAAARKKRRGRSGGDSGDESGGAIPPEENHSQIIQYIPTSNGDFPDSFLRSLAQAMPLGATTADFHDAFRHLQLGQVCMNVFPALSRHSTHYTCVRWMYKSTSCSSTYLLPAVSVVVACAACAACMFACIAMFTARSASQDLAHTLQRCSWNMVITDMPAPRQQVAWHLQTRHLSQWQQGSEADIQRTASVGCTVVTGVSAIVALHRWTTADHMVPDQPHAKSTDGTTSLEFHHDTDTCSWIGLQDVAGPSVMIHEQASASLGGPVGEQHTIQACHNEMASCYDAIVHSMSVCTTWRCQHPLLTPATLTQTSAWSGHVQGLTAQCHQMQQHTTAEQTQQQWQLAYLTCTWAAQLTCRHSQQLVIAVQNTGRLQPSQKCPI